MYTSVFASRAIQMKREVTKHKNLYFYSNIDTIEQRLYLCLCLWVDEQPYLAVEGGGGGERTMLVGSPMGMGFAPGGLSPTILTGTEGTGGPTDNE